MRSKLLVRMRLVRGKSLPSKVDTKDRHGVIDIAPVFSCSTSLTWEATEGLGEGDCHDQKVI